MTEPRTGLRGRLAAMTRPEWVWLAAAALVALATLAALLGFGAYYTSEVTGAGEAVRAELAASKINALEWQAIATGEVTPAIREEVRQQQVALTRHVAETGPQADQARSALVDYTAAIRAEFSFIEAGQLKDAQAYDEQTTDPTFARLQAALRGEAADRTASADESRVYAIAGEVLAVILGFGGAALLLLRVGRVQRELAASETEQRVLQETSKAKSDLISVVSHDLRTPLTSIVGYLEILSEEEAGPISDEQRQFLAIIQRNADRLLTIVNDLLFISRAEEHRLVLNVSELRLAEAAAEAVEAQQLRARAHEIDLELRSSPAPPIRGDRARIDELIENLLSNAIKFTPPGGAVRVSVRHADGKVRLEVSDTGVGISAEDQVHLFERFFRAPTVIGTPGTGLGLAIVKAIAGAHHAALGVTSALGEGATFWVEFPPASAARPDDQPPAGPAPAGGPPRP